MKAFLQKLSKSQVPKEVPNWIQHRVKPADAVKAVIHIGCRDMVIRNHGMWVLVDLKWTKQLASWIGNRKVLEIMAGCGWLAKALNHHGVNITATDDFSWGVDKIQNVFEVQQFDAIEAVRSLGQKHDILLVS